MSPSTHPAEPLWPELAASLARWVVACAFISMGLTKALNPEPFITLVRQYEVVTNPYALNAISAFLPWFEVFCGLLLVAGVAVRGAALTLALLLAPFTALILKRGLALAGAKAIALCAVKFDCGCGHGEVYVCPKLAENCVMLLVTLWLISGRGRWWCLRYSLFRAAPSQSPSPRA